MTAPTRRGGLRLQLLLLLGALMVLSYVPLFYATSTYTRYSLEQLQRENATKLGVSVATHLAALRQQSDDESFLVHARAQIEKESVHAIAVLKDSGPPLALLGEYELFNSLSAETSLRTAPEVREIQSPLGPAILIYEPMSQGAIAALVRIDGEITRAEPLASLMALYMGVGGLALLAATYFALTRWIVRPLLELSHSAERIAAGGHRLEGLKHAPRELCNLSLSLAEMTQKLRSEEKTLRAKVDELEALTLELKDAQASLVRSEKLATVGRLAAGLAHEIGNPITALMGLQDLMIEGGLSQDEQEDFLLRMRKETARIDRVLSDLLAYARPTGGTSGTNGTPGATAPHSGSLTQSIESTLSLLQPQKHMQNMAFTSAVEKALPLVPLSQEELTQVLLNLMMNATDACGKAGRVKVQALRHTEKTVEFSVADDGPGISSTIEESLFEPFVSTKEVGQGTGLGLAVSKGLVEAAGGSIFVERSEWGGARFVVHLPALSETIRPPTPSRLRNS